MEKLKEQLEGLVSLLENESELRQRIGNLFSVFPFNEYEYIISTLLGLGKLSLDEYYELRDEYISRNMFLYVFEISAPRGFGETWMDWFFRMANPGRAWLSRPMIQTTIPLKQLECNAFTSRPRCGDVEKETKLIF